MPTPLQMKIIEQLKVKPVIDAETEFRTRVDFMKDYLLKSGQKGFVLGLSGGADSAATGVICSAAIKELRKSTGRDYKLLSLLLPFGEQRDILDSRAVAHFLESDIVIEFNIKESVEAMESEFNRHLALPNFEMQPLQDFHRGNSKSRARMMAMYLYSGQMQLLVAGCSNACEILVGFSTIHGDAGVDILALEGLNKRQVKQILEYRNAPNFLLSKNPTADLLDENPEQSDEDSLQITYEIMDDYLEGKDILPSDAASLEQKFFATGYKRHMPVTHYDTWYKEAI